MKVALFSDTYPPEINGVATSCRTLHNSLLKHGHECLVVTTNPYGFELALDHDVMRLPGIRLRHLYDYRMAWVYNSGAMRIVREFQPDLIHIQTDYGIGQFGYIAANKLKIPTVYTYHTMLEDYTYYVTKGVFDRAAKGILRMYMLHRAHTADEFIAPAEKTKEYMRSVMVDKYVSVIPTGIDFQAFAADNNPPEIIASIKKKYGLNDDEFVFVSLGRVAKEKSIDVLLRGYAIFKNEHPELKTKFVIVGGGPALNELKELSQTLKIDDSVVFVGPINPDEIHYYYYLGDIFINASVTETQGLTFMEALAASRILLVRYDDSLRGLIKERKNGFFFLDENDLAKKLLYVMSLSSEMKKEIRMNGLESIEPYSLERFYENIIRVYKRALRNKW